MKKLFLFIVFFSFGIMVLYAQKATKKALADAAWNAMPVWDEYRKMKNTSSLNDKEWEIQQDEIFYREYMEAGLDFWDRFSNDPRRYTWLFNVSSYWEPSFWKDMNEAVKAKAAAELSRHYQYTADIDWRLLNKWENRRQQLNKIAMADPSLDRTMKSNIQRSTLNRELRRSLNTVYHSDKARFIEKIKVAFANPLAYFDVQERTFAIDRCIETLFLQFNRYGLNMEDLIAFANYFRDSKYPEMQEWAAQKLRVFALMNHPFELKHTTIDGEEIDLTKLRGKVVLVDFWSNTCTVCIARMPAIKAVYDKYKEQGFTVISAAKNPDIDKDKILKIHKKIGADWPVVLLGGESKQTGVVAPNSPADQIFKKYGFNFVPQLFLLNKQGKLVLYNGPLLNSDFESFVKALLAEKSTDSNSFSAVDPTLSAANFNRVSYEAEEEYKDFQQNIQAPFSQAYTHYTNIVQRYTGHPGTFTEEDFKNRPLIDSMRMALASQTYKLASQTYIKNTILWISMHPDALLTPDLIMRWWPKKDWTAAYNKLTPRAQQSFYGKELKDRLSKQFVISAKINGLPDNTRLYLVRASANNRADTVQRMVSKNGMFTFSGEITVAAEMHFIRIDPSVELGGRQNWIRVLLDNSVINITGDLNKWPTVSIKGSAVTDTYEAYYKSAAPYITKINAVSEDSIKKKSALNDFKQFALNYFQSNRYSYVTPLLILKNRTLNTNEKDAFFNTLPVAVKNSFYGKKLLQEIATQNRIDRISKLVNNKNQVPDFSFTKADGTKTSILQIAAQSKYTLIDFWASWCVPCRKSVPKLKKVYEAFHEKGFNILGISTDTNQEAWKKALAEDKTPWLQAIDDIDFAGKNIFPLAAVPAYILIDRKGTIIATDYFLIGENVKIVKEDEKTLSGNLKEIIEGKLNDG